MNVLEPITVSEQTLYSTLPISTQNSRGSGFIFMIEEGDARIPILITNKHVTDGALFIELRFHLAKDGRPSGQIQSVAVQGLPIAGHPSPSVDLCAIPLAPFFEQLNAAGVTPYFVSLNHDQLPELRDLEDLSALENVTMVGYPNGLSDQANNFPILRRGVTASHPIVNFNGMAEGAVDMACFPGSSGSPIFILDEGGYRDRKGNTYMGRTRFFLLGVLYGGPVMNQDGEIQIRTIPTAQVPIPVTQMMIHLGYYVKAQEVRVLVEHVKRLVGAQG